MQIERTVTLTVKNTIIKLTGTVAISGQVRVPGTIVEASQTEAKELILRGKANPATQEDVDGAATIIATGTIDSPTGPDPLTWQAAAAWGR